jgi:hypothetical protein
MSEPVDRKIAITMGVLLGAMALCVIGLVVHAGWPKGEKIASIDLRTVAGSATVDVGAGDRIHFRTTISIAPPPSKVAGFDALRTSKLAVELVGPTGAATSAACAVYADEAMSVSNVASGMTVEDAPIACSFTVATSGKHVVKPKVAWSPSASVTTAVLEVRREKK